MTEQYKNIPSELKNMKQWVCYKLETVKGKVKKTPKNPNSGGYAKSNDATTWVSYDDAIKGMRQYKFDGIGIMFANGVCGIDIDHCVDNGVLSPLAEDIVHMMNSYTEISPSGTGLHILFTGSIDEAPDFYKKNPNNGVEMYTHERYFTVTGNSITGADSFGDRTDNVKSVQSKYMRRKATASSTNAVQLTAPGPLLTDDEILNKANNSSKAAEFKKLWNGDISGYNSHSDADLALCNMLAFWSGKDAATIDRLFRQSKLMRNKWDTKHGQDTYGAITVKKAVDTCNQVYNPNNGPYIEKDGCVWRKTGQNEKYIANFTAYPIEDMTRDNGAETSKYFVVGGKLATGEPLPKIQIAAAEFSSMNWVIKHWGLQARIAPGSNNKDYIRDYIQSQAADIMKSTVYTHTGFRVINNTLCYLYNGGAIGADNISCELEGGLSEYTFIENTQGITETAAANEVLELFKLAPPEVSYPLLAFTYLAPLNYFLQLEGVAPAFSLFLVGETGSFKTVMSMLYLAHFRKYNGMSETPPVNFHSTSNAIERMSFDLKDALLLIDDYHPTTASDKKRMDQIAQRLARGAGDHTGRSRMNNDTTLKASFVPRGLSMVTGEDLPDVGQSGLARYYFVNFKKGCIDTAALTERQNNARLLNFAMQGFIKWLIRNAEDVRHYIKKEYIQQLNKVNISDSHSRTAPVISWLQLAVKVFVNYLYDIDAMTEAEGVTFAENSWTVFLNGGAEQATTQAAETPVNIFISVLSELLASGKKATEDINALAKDAPPPERSIGYHDDHYVYLRQNETYNAVVETLKHGGRDFPVSKYRIIADLIKAGHAEGQSGSNTVKKRIYNTNLRYWKIKKLSLGIEERCN